MTSVLAVARELTGVPYSWPAPDGDDSDCADFANAVCRELGRDGGTHDDEDSRA